MRNALYAAAAAVALFAVAPASATVVNLTQNGEFYTGTFDHQGIAAGGFTDTWTFLPPLGDAKASISFSHLAADPSDPGDQALTLIDVTLDGFSILSFFNPLDPGANALLLSIPLFPGDGVTPHEIIVTGTGFGNTSYSGTINFRVLPVPEPATWGMMVAGIAAVGASMRRRSQKVRVAFS
jgi:hypothetical protein